MDLVKRMQDQMGEWFVPQLPQSMNGISDGMDGGGMLGAGGKSASMSILQAKGNQRERGGGSPNRASPSGDLPNRMSLSAWTLWSFVGPALPPQKQDFQSMSEAKMAFESCKAQAIPCMLRDPTGGAYSKYNWVAFNFTLPPRLAPSTSRAASPGPPARPDAYPPAWPDAYPPARPDAYQRYY